MLYSIPGGAKECESRSNTQHGANDIESAQSPRKFRFGTAPDNSRGGGAKITICGRVEYIRIVSALLCVSMTAGCAYSPLYHPPPHAKPFYEYRQDKGPVTLAVKPLVTGSDAAMIFGADLMHHGVLPIELILFNDSPDECDLSAVEVNVKGAAGEGAAFLSPAEVFLRAKRSTAGRSVGWGIAGSLLLFFTLPFAFVAGRDSWRANRQTKKALLQEGKRPERLLSRSYARWYIFLDKSTISRETSGGEEDDLLISLRGVKMPNASESLYFSIVCPA